MTDTAKYADIVLPATTHIEASDVTTAWGHLWMGWNEAAIAPPAPLRDSMTIGLPSAAATRSKMMVFSASLLPPAAEGLISVTGRCG